MNPTKWGRSSAARPGFFFLLRVSLPLRKARDIRVTIHGASVVPIRAGKITGWRDYYNGLAAGRTALSAHFTSSLEF